MNKEFRFEMEKERLQVAEILNVMNKILETLPQLMKQLDHSFFEKELKRKGYYQSEFKVIHGCGGYIYRFTQWPQQPRDFRKDPVDGFYMCVKCGAMYKTYDDIPED